MEECAWQVAGVPTTITLTAANGEKYVGDPLTVSSDADVAIIVGLSGSVTPSTATIGDSTECTFYNAQKYPVLNVAMSSTSVRATYPLAGVATADPALSFNVGVGRPLTVDTTQTCDPDFESPLTASNLTDNNATTLLSMVDDTIENQYAATLAPRCTIATGYSLEIPGITGVPAAPGADYSFSGGSVSFLFAAN
jgi:hypothetical protein